MSNFELEGRLDIANAIVGSFHNDDLSMDQTFVIALLPEGTTPKVIRKTKEQILLQAQDKFILWDHTGESRLTELFNRLSGSQLSLTIKDPSPTADIIDLAISKGKPKNVIYCTNIETYLSVCSRFGISKRDMTSIAELKALLPKPTIATAEGGIVGYAHKVCNMMATGKAKYIMNDALNVSITREEMSLVISNIQRAIKFDCGSYVDIGNGTESLVKDILKGQRKVYLPYERCLFEFDVDGKKLLLLAQRLKNSANIIDRVISDEDFGVFPIGVDTTHGVCRIFPYSLLFYPKNGILKDSEMNFFYPDWYSSEEAERFFEEHKKTLLGPITRGVLMALAAFNSPSHKIEIKKPPEALRKKREEKTRTNPTEFPYFDYHILKVSPQTVGENFANLSSIRKSSSESQGLWHQKFHQRSGYLREVIREGVPETILIEDYFAGDARLGIVGKSKKAEIKHTPS